MLLTVFGGGGLNLLDKHLNIDDFECMSWNIMEQWTVENNFLFSLNKALAATYIKRL